MDWQKLFLSANGRISQKEFWIGFAILFVGGFVLGLIPLINLLAIVLVYPWVCLYSKRLHDFGRSGWLAAVPFGLGVVAMVLMFGTLGAAILGASAAQSGGAAAAGFGLGFAGVGLIMMLIGLAGLGFLLWVGLSKGDPAANAYGPPPVDGVTIASV